MAAITITPAESKADLKSFIRFPWTIYRGNAAWVPPLVADQGKFFDRKQNPFFEHARAQYFLARRDNEVVGRIAAHVDDKHNEFHGEKCGFFGFFESIEDQGVANALFDAAKAWIRRSDDVS